MFLPFADVPDPKGYRPWVTWALFGANIAVFLVLLPLDARLVPPSDPRLLDYLAALARELPPGALQSRELQWISEYDLFLFEHGYRSAQPTLAALFGSMFLHGGMLHLAGNMLFLWIYANNIEQRFGHGLFLGAYLLAGVVATLAFSWLSPPTMLPMVGASGAISGVLGSYFLLFPHNRVRVLVMLLPFFVRVVELPARLVLGLFVLLDNLFPLLLGVHSGVAHGAHLGGFVAGLGLGWLAEQITVRREPPGSHTPAERAQAHLELAQRYLARRHYASAYEHLRRAEWLDPAGRVGFAARRVREATFGDG